MKDPSVAIHTHRKFSSLTQALLTGKGGEMEGMIKVGFVNLL